MLSAARPSLLCAVGCVLLLAAAASPARASGTVAIRGETLNRTHPDPLLHFGEARTVSLVPYMPGLARLAVADDAIVLLSGGGIGVADEEFADEIWYDENDEGRDIAKLLSVPGSALLFEAVVGGPQQSQVARLSLPDGELARYYRDPGVIAVPEPGILVALGSGLLLLGGLSRLRVRR